MFVRPAGAAAVLLALAACGDGTANGGNGAIAAPRPTAVAASPAPVGHRWVETVVRTPEGGYRMGNPDAAVKLVEYGSRTCPHCALFDAEGLPALKAGPIASGRLSYEFRDFPVHSALDIGPILLGQCLQPAQFFPMLDAMMRAQETLLANAQPALDDIQAHMADASPSQIATTIANRLGYVDFVKQRGVTDQHARACLADPAAAEAIARGMQTANDQFQVAGTPTFIVNGTVVPNVADWAGLQPALRAAGAM